MGVTQLNLPVQSIQEIQPPGLRVEAASTFFDQPPYTVVVIALDWKHVPSTFDINYPSGESNTLIKYSRAEDSPVSSQPSDCIKLGTGSHYRSLDATRNSELIVDEFDSAFLEKLNWTREGTKAMEAIKAESRSFGFKHKLAVEMKFVSDDHWMFCTSIDPNSSEKRRVQLKNLSPEYNFMTSIGNPSDFAKLLGRDLGRQINLIKDFKCNDPALYRLASAHSQATKPLGDYSIFVNHGFVIYLDDREIETFMVDLPNEVAADFLPFVKRKKYKEQQEYRFLISVNFHTPKNDILYLKVSDELRNLMAPERSEWTDLEIGV